ncbi:tRNA (adenosine(37)-N6)-dimethylallyltransferase MiaA [Albibacterium indicum]|uniref:tRNA (adenosine(37)-N6)-dimethylallyltransferase MiaA n=1 Tax=Albibacterium indicum TaxID=2292082 RepID=UPI000E4B1776|nr:tRNA (adenosine(37)-N6)-dimethylallyltransferase MiaA [Pedobacter indicus]
MSIRHAKTLVCVVGPTAVGKTSTAIELARHYQTEIISADSRQFYQEMNIGTAKPDMQELTAATHHFIDSHSITEDYSAGDYEVDVLNLLEQLFKKHDVLIMVGGSGLFINAACYGLDKLPKPAAGVREQLTEDFEKKGVSYLQEKLLAADPEYYMEVDHQNPQRMIRALEVFETTGIAFSKWRKKDLALRNFNILPIGLHMDRDQLYERINLRVDKMLDDGLLKEVKDLLPHRNKSPLQSVGYSELFDYLDGSISLERAIELIKRNSRRYAKRQITWFKKMPDIQWFDPKEPDSIRTYIDTFVNGER